jgi:hypothetical protein
MPPRRLVVAAAVDEKIDVHGSAHGVSIRSGASAALNSDGLPG